MAHPNEPPKPQYDEVEEEVDDDEESLNVGDDEGLSSFHEGSSLPGGLTPSTSAYSSFEEGNKDEEIEVEKEMAEDDEDS